MKNARIKSNSYRWVLCLFTFIFAVAESMTIHAEINSRKQLISEPSGLYQQKNGHELNNIVTGLVVDSIGEPIIGATIMIKGAKGKGAITGINGDYIVNLTEGDNTVLVFSFMGYATVERKVGKEREINITLEDNFELLDEVVVVAYGKQKKQTMVSAVESVNPEVLKSTGTQLTSSFAGRLSGVISYQRSGEPGNDAASVFIRGIASPNSQSPLVIIDGIQQNMQELNYLDPSVIRDFSVLKDAAATALYGTLGANGVIVVNTKIGDQMKKPKITSRIENHIQIPTNNIDYVDGPRFMNLYNEALTHPNSAEIAASSYSEEKIRMTEAGKDPLVYPNVDWRKESFKSMSHSQKAVIDINGGSSRATYFTSLSVIHETGLLKNRARDFRSFGNDIDNWVYVLKNNFGINLSSSSRIESRLSVRLHDNKSPNTSPRNMYNYIRRANPVDFPVIFDKNDERVQYLDGKSGDIKNFNHFIWGGNDNTPNPIAELVDGFESRFHSTINANVDFNQKLNFITKGLDLKLSFNFKNYMQTSIKREIAYNRYFLRGTELDVSGEEMVKKYSLQRIGSTIKEEILQPKQSSWGDRELFLQGLITYSRLFQNKHDVNGMLMFSQTEWYNNTPGGNDLFASLPKRKQSVSGRVSYAYDKKYLLEGNFGATGSENFAKGHRWGVFPSVAVGYVISQERFWEPLSAVIPYFKIRYSRGKSGSDYLGRDGSNNERRFGFQEKIILNSLGYETGIQNDHPYNKKGPEYNRFRNDMLTWEVAEKQNLGFDLNMLNCVDISLELFKEDRKNVFVQRRTVPEFLGLGDAEILTNLGEVKNYGFDGSINYKCNLNQHLAINLRGTFTYAHNEYVKWDEPTFMEYPSSSRIGQTIHGQLLLLADGLIKSQEEADAIHHNFGSKLTVGDIKYIDQPNGEGVKNDIIDGNDRLFYGYPVIPEVVYGLSVGATYKNFDLSLLMQGQDRVSLIMSNLSPFGKERNNIHRFIADGRYDPEKNNLDAEFPRLTATASDYNNQASTFWYRNAAFLKLKYLELGYSYKNYRFYLSGSNLFCFSSFKYWDPERGGNIASQYPTMQTFTVGVNILF